MSDTNSIDITETGPLNYRQLRDLNSSQRTPEVTQLLMRPSGTRASTRGLGRVSHTLPSGDFDDFGSSSYDADLANYDQIANRQDIRAEEQPWIAKIGAGLAKGAILAGTTFLDGTVGLLLGSVEALNRGDISGLYDNDISRALRDVNDWAEKVLPNYYSTEEQNSPWYENIFTANFIGDKFIKNLGFAVGALYSGGVASTALKATRLPQLIGAITNSTKAPAMISSLIGATTSAVNEGRIEALNNSEDWQNLKIQELDDAWMGRIQANYAPEIKALEAEYKAAYEEFEATKGNLQKVDTGDGRVTYIDPAMQKLQAKLTQLDYRKGAIQGAMETEWNNRNSDDIYNRTLSKIAEDRLKMGNVDMLANLPILMASNLVQFTKFYANGFNTARRAGVKTLPNIAENGARYAGKTFSKGKYAARALGNAVIEGTEEISQKAASLIAGDYYSTDVDNFYKAQIDPDAEQETLDWMKSLASGINQTVNDSASWEEFFIGSLTGLIGVPSFRSTRSSDGKFQSPITLQGGAFNTLKEYREEIARSEEIANYLNSRVQSPEFINYYRGLIRHNKYQADMNTAAGEDDAFNFKNAEHAQFVSDIIMFDNAGKLGDLRTYIDAAYDTSIENLQSIVENTTATNEDGTKTGPFIDSTGNPAYATEESEQQMIDKLTQSRDTMLDVLDNYRKTKNDIDVRTGGNLSNEQLTEMTWLKTQVDDWTKRAKDMAPLIKKTLTDLSTNLESTLVKSLATVSLEPNSEELIENVGEAAKKAGIGADRIRQLQQLSLMDEDRLASILTHPKNEKFVEDLIEDIDTFGSSIISSLDKQNVIKLLQDLPKIGKGIETFNNKLEEYLANPDKLKKAQEKATEETKQAVQEKKTQGIRDKLSSVGTTLEFRNILNQEEDSDLKKGIVEDLINEGNQVALNYKEKEQYSSELKRAIQEQEEDSSTIADALALWNKQYEWGERVTQIANPNSIVLNDEFFFDETSEGNRTISEQRFLNAKYVLQKAMSKVNNNISFKNRFSEAYKAPVNERVQRKGADKNSKNTAKNGASNTPVGDTAYTIVIKENEEINKGVKTQKDLNKGQTGQRKYYRPAIPELHIEASKEGDFRPFDVVANERDSNVDFSEIYSYLRDNGAFSYVNAAKLKPGDTLGFMIDPEFNDHTIFLVDTRNNQIVGSIDESDTSVSRYEGLGNLIKKVREEFENRNTKNEGNTTSETSTDKFFATPKIRVSQIMIGKIPLITEERSLADIPGVLDGDTKPIFGIIKNGMLTTNEKVEDRLIIKPLDLAQKEGRLYLLIPNAAGTYSPAAVRVKHFNKEEFDLNDVTNANTVIGEEINEALDKIVDAGSQEDVSIAMKDLVQNIYMQDIVMSWFDASIGNGVTIIRKLRNPDGSYVMTTTDEGQEIIKEEKAVIYYSSIKKSVELNGRSYTLKEAKAANIDLSLFREPKDPSKIKEEILNALYKHNLPIQISARKINNPGYNDRVIKSNVLTSNLREAKVISSWFTTDYFDNQGNLQKAIDPPSIKIAPNRKITTPVGGVEGVIQGTKVSIKGTPYVVDLKKDIVTNEKTGETRTLSSLSTLNAQLLRDMAWAQDNFGDATESSVMTENKIITPVGAILDRNIGSYITGEEAQRIKDKIAGKKENDEIKIAKSNRIIADIYENQNRVDKSRTDNQYYYILEDDGQYHQYSRVHTILGDNWIGPKGKNSERALEAGSAIDSVIRKFFTSEEAPTKPDILSDNAFTDLITKLTEIKSRMKDLGETFKADNIVLFQKYPDGTRIAGEVDILSITQNGDFKIYDVKTSRSSFTGRYFTEKSQYQRMSTKDYYTLQLSAYQNLFESQYGVRPTTLAILPFVLTYDTTKNTTIDIPSGKQTKLGLPITSGQGYFRTDKVLDDEDARFVSSEKDGKIYFKPILDTPAHEGVLKSNDAAKSVVEFIGGDPKEATSFVLIEPGEVTRDSEKKRLTVNKKAKIFAVTPDTPYSPTNAKTVVSAVHKEKGISITYNPAVNVPLIKATPVVQSATQQKPLPIFNSSIETMITDHKKQDRIIPENAFEEGGEIGYYEKDGNLYTGYLKKVGEIEVTAESGQKFMLPIHLTKVRDIGFGREGEFGSTSEYIPVFPNGKAISTYTNDTNDDHAAEIIMEALSKKPDKVLALSLEKTQIYNDNILNEISGLRTKEDTPSLNTSQSGGAFDAIQAIDSVNDHDDEFEGDVVLRLRKTDSSSEVWNEKEELAWLKKVLPQLSEQDRIRVKKGLIQVSENGPIAWGMFSDGIVTLSDIAAKGTTYHEAFHVVFNLMLTNSEKEALYEESRQIYGNKTLLELEEDMAEGFREYVISQDNRGLGRRILDFFKSLFAKMTNWKFIKPSLTAYYGMINQGRYRKTDLGQSNATRLKEEEYTSEMKNIKAKAIADGTFMKAPNGNPTNLNERQWLQVRTKNFINWFGDWINNPSEASKVVDENGEPLVVYHTTKEVNTSKINIFQKQNKYRANDLFYFSDSKESSQTYFNGKNTLGDATSRKELLDEYKEESEFEKVTSLQELESIVVNKIESINNKLNNIQNKNINKGPKILGKLDSTTGQIIRNNVSDANNEINILKSSLNYYEGILNNITPYIRVEREGFNNILESQTYPVFLNIRIPAIIDAKNKDWHTFNMSLGIKYDFNPENFYFENYSNTDGLVISNFMDARWEKDTKFSTTYAVENSNQIKSATSNTGDFSTTNDDIRYKAVEDFNKTMRRETQRFLDNFDITIKDVSEFEDGDLFDALNRVINVKTAEDVSEGVGYAIAFMMQHNTMMNTLMKYKIQLNDLRGIRKSLKVRGDYNASISLKDLPFDVRQKYIREIGKDIASELRKLYNLEPIKAEPKSFLAKLWDLITKFYNLLTPSALAKFHIIRSYTRNIANSIKLNDPSIIRITDFKPGTDEPAVRVDLSKALKENPYERSIVEFFNSKGIALAGSASIAVEGALYRPIEDPLHDLDFNASDFSKESLDNLIKETFPNNEYIREIKEGPQSTQTYLVLDRPFVSKRDIKGVAKYTIYDKETDEKLGTWEGSKLTLKKGVKGIFLDFFLHEENKHYPYKVFNMNGKSYLIADYREAINAKVTWQRPKDIWDYNRFNFGTTLESLREEKERREAEVKELLQSARIIWAHPAIGKTTYLERNQDILEWDQEVNPKRNEFIRDQIDPKHEMDINSNEYKILKKEYMKEWKSHPEYIEFLTNEWESLKRRAIKENKRIFASPAPLIEIGANDIDLFVNLPEKEFLERGEARGNSHLGAMGWKQLLNSLLTRVDPNKVFTTNKYFSEFMRDNLGVQWGTLTNEEEAALIKKGWTKEQFDRISQAERDNALECVVL